MYLRIALIILGAAIMPLVVMLRTEPLMFIAMYPVFLLAAVAFAFTYQRVFNRLLRDDAKRWQRLCAGGVYYLLWSGFFLFIAVAGISHV